jgi:peptide deformylase
MANRKILTWPHPKLRQVSTPVKSFDRDLCDLADDLVDTLKVSLGAGLAAPQIGVNKQVVAIRCVSFGHENPEPHEKDSDVLVMVNPVLEVTGETVRWTESCLSIPGHSAAVERYENARVQYQTLSGEARSIEAKWPFSGALQHECDHLRGVLFTFKLTYFERSRIEKKIKKRKRDAARAVSDYERQMKLERRGIYDEEAHKRMTHGPGKRKKKKAKRSGKTYGKNK